MRTTSTSGRVAAPDRNATRASLLWTAPGTAPNALTINNSYTVPAGKKASVDGVYASWMRATAAAPIGRAELQVGQLFGGNFYPLVDLPFINNGVGAIQFSTNGTNGTFLAGEVLQIRNVDLSTGGTVDYLACITILQYDA